MKLKKALLTILYASATIGMGGCKEDQDLGSDYYYFPPYEALDIGYPAKAALYKSKEKWVFDNIIAEGDIELIGFNEKWIAFVYKFPELIAAYTINKNTGIKEGPYFKTEDNQSVMKEFGLDDYFHWK